ncbi:ATP-binding cassette domain-containing protein [Streptomyces litchfieldiae]|uniref:ATP-binding cassette domain-containing protein n=1 Tax=Streptomyces litchfieldiae TaxID=3075543 RepID=A0ABU2MME4_9ACTN|nr:ATP-binding cassette domain-containing protein [Streptomyces sp. DSM 44938]MDT0342770.1 ATP-binding cassette domain-containing protein [Streptomyces sp. DSM 44938]
MVHVSPEAAAAPMLKLRGVFKRYGAVQALADVELEIRAGEVVALVGDNGAGKSTLVRVIAGADPADEGVIEWKGERTRINRPQDARALGIATVYQDLSLCENLDVVGNLFLAREVHRVGVLDEVEMERRARGLLDTLAIQIPSLRVPVSALSAGQRQTIALSRALLGEPEAVLLDEPTAALGIEQATHTIDLIDSMRERGLGVLIISHNLADVKAVADQVAVLRLGRNNGFFDVKTTSQEQIIASITGATDNAVRRAGRSWP